MAHAECESVQSMHLWIYTVHTYMGMGTRCIRFLASLCGRYRASSPFRHVSTLLKHIQSSINCTYFVSNAHRIQTCMFGECGTHSKVVVISSQYDMERNKSEKAIFRGVLLVNSHTEVF